MKTFLRNLKNMLTAMAYAEVGDFDAVKQILQRKDAYKFGSKPDAGAKSFQQPAIPVN